MDEQGIDQTGLYQPVVQGDYVAAEKPLLYSTSMIGNAGAVMTEEQILVEKPRRRTNFVTSDNYNPQAHLREIDNLLSRSQAGVATS